MNKTQHTVKKIGLVCCIGLLVPLMAVAQNDLLEGTHASVLNLAQLRKNVIEAPTEKARLAANEDFIDLLQTVLNRPESFEWSFDSLKYTAVLQSPDEAFRMYNWNVPLDNNTHRYFCYIQYRDKKEKTIKVIRLEDNPVDVPNLDRALIKPKDWYGALYYEIIPVKRGKKKYYTLLGWDGNNGQTTRKVIDVLQFYPNRPPRFGAGLFAYKKERPKRIVFEYSSQVVMSLRYDHKEKKIVFDHLAPINPSLEGQYQFYSPDASFDALELTRGKWVYSSDIDARGQGGDEGYVYPPGLEPR